MHEIHGDFWDLIDDYDALVITTNGFVKRNGEAVMGRGIAKEAKERYPWLPANLGLQLKTKGNHVYRFDLEPDFIRHKPFNLSLYTFPVKPEFGPNGEMGWKAKADLALIEQSCIELLADISDNVGADMGYKVLMPRPGCGNGGLKWEEVKPILKPYLDRRFTIITF